MSDGFLLYASYHQLRYELAQPDWDALNEYQRAGWERVAEQFIRNRQASIHSVPTEGDHRG